MESTNNILRRKKEDIFPDVLK